MEEGLMKLRQSNIQGDRLRKIQTIFSKESRLTELILKEQITELRFYDGSYFEDSHKFAQILGAGAFGLVVAARQYSSQEMCAIKILCKDNIKCQDLETLRRETLILNDLSHECVIKLIGTKENKHFLLMFLEFLPGGTLEEWIVYKNQIKREPILIEEEARGFMKSLIRGVEHIHFKGYAHRDIKPENIMFGIPGDANTLRIADFGLSTKCNETLSGVVGTMTYMAPEILKRENYSSKVDIWACGIIFFKLLTGRHPISKVEGPREQFIESVLSSRWHFPRRFSLLTHDFFKKLCEADPKKRLSAKQALAHPWISETWEEPQLVDAKTAAGPFISVVRVLAFFQAIKQAEKKPQIIAKINKSKKLFERVLLSHKKRKVLPSLKDGSISSKNIVKILNRKSSEIMKRNNLKRVLSRNTVNLRTRTNFEPQIKAPSFHSKLSSSPQNESISRHSALWLTPSHHLSRAFGFSKQQNLGVDQSPEYFMEQRMIFPPARKESQQFKRNSRICIHGFQKAKTKASLSKIINKFLEDY